VAACRALGLDAWHDPQNADPAFQRVRLRREVLPLLEDVLAGGVAEALARTAVLLQDDLAALDSVAAHRLSEVADVRPPDAPGHALGDAKLDVPALAAQPRAIRTRILRAWAAAAGADPLTAEHTSRLDALVTAWRGQGPVDLPGGRRVARSSGKLVVTCTAPDHLE
jgi:tRNA(Ile)-lysidine synthase